MQSVKTLLLSTVHLAHQASTSHLGVQNVHPAMILVQSAQALEITTAVSVLLTSSKLKMESANSASSPA